MSTISIEHRAAEVQRGSNGTVVELSNLYKAFSFGARLVAEGESELDVPMYCKSVNEVQLPSQHTLVSSLISSLYHHHRNQSTCTR